MWLGTTGRVVGFVPASTLLSFERPPRVTPVAGLGGA